MYITTITSQNVPIILFKSTSFNVGEDEVKCKCDGRLTCPYRKGRYLKSQPAVIESGALSRARTVI